MNKKQFIIYFSLGVSFVLLFSVGVYFLANKKDNNSPVKSVTINKDSSEQLVKDSAIKAVGGEILLEKEEQTEEVVITPQVLPIEQIAFHLPIATAISKEEFNNIVSQGTSLANALYDYPQFNDRFTLPTKKAVSAILEFYSNISTKNYTDAYAFSSKSITYDQFVELYKDVDSLMVGFIYEKADSSYTLQVTLSENEKLTTYLVNMVLHENNDVYSLQSASSVPYSGKVLLSCGDQGTGSTLCYFSDQSTGDILHISYNMYSRTALLYKESYKHSADSEILYSGYGDAGNVGKTIYEYYPSSQELIDRGGFVLALNQPPTYDSQAPCYRSDWDLSAMASYEDECLKSNYGSEQWFIDNLKYIQAEKKYFGVN